MPRLGRVEAQEGFRLVAAMNPFDAVGTARIAGAVYDRVCRVAMGYQSAEDERSIVGSQHDDVPARVQSAAVEIVRATREHPDLRTGSSIRGAIDLCAVAENWLNCDRLRSTMMRSLSTLRLLRSRDG